MSTAATADGEADANPRVVAAYDETSAGDREKNCREFLTAWPIVDRRQAIPCGGGWLRYWDQEEDANYYHNPETGTTSWVEPKEPQSAAEGSASQESPVQDGACPLPENRIAPPPEDAASQGGYSYHDGYEWDTYARLYGYPSGYHAYYDYYWGRGNTAHQSGTTCMQGTAQPGNDSANMAMPRAGGIIYEPTAQAHAAAEVNLDALSRLDKILAMAPGAKRDEAHASELVQHAGGTRTPSQGAAAELTEAQKIFGVGETFAPHAVAVSAQPRGREQEWAPAESDEPQRLTAELIAESARRLEEQAAGAPGVRIADKDVRRHGNLSGQVAVEKALLAAVENPNPAGSTASPYVGQASFNKRTGKFEGAGQVYKIAVNDPRRQTSHFFDYDKWSQVKASERSAKKAKTGAP